ncbi:MAG: glycosyltransferase [Planctomycetota bacterium]
MIFVVTGTHEQPFDRLLRAVDGLATAEQRVVQVGNCSYAPQNCDVHEFLAFDAVQQLMREADVVITHAGTGSAMLALSVGKLPVVAPRYACHGEHIDDHQLQLVNALVGDGMAVPYLDGDDLEARIEAARAADAGRRAIQPDRALLDALRGMVDA